jgi:hypothetical protein
MCRTNPLSKPGCRKMLKLANNRPLGFVGVRHPDRFHPFSTDLQRPLLILHAHGHGSLSAHCPRSLGSNQQQGDLLW